MSSPDVLHQKRTWIRLSSSPSVTSVQHNQLNQRSSANIVLRHGVQFCADNKLTFSLI